MVPILTLVHEPFSAGSVSPYLLPRTVVGVGVVHRHGLSLKESLVTFGHCWLCPLLGLNQGNLPAPRAVLHILRDAHPGNGDYKPYRTCRRSRLWGGVKVPCGPATLAHDTAVCLSLHARHGGCDCARNHNGEMHPQL